MEPIKTILDYMNEDSLNRHKDGQLYTLTDQEILRNEFYDLYNFDIYAHQTKNFEGWDKYEGIFIAGGIFSNGDIKYITDLDVFIYANHEKNLERLELLLAPTYQYSYSKHTTNFSQFQLGLKIQIIRRKYTTIAEILYGFDMGPSQVGYDVFSKTFYTTVMGKLAFDTGIMIVDTKRRSTSFVYRICKYQKKGFKLILPFAYIDDKRQNINGEYIDTWNEGEFCINARRAFLPNGGYDKSDYGNHHYRENTLINYLLGITDDYLVKTRDMNEYKNHFAKHDLDAHLCQSLNYITRDGLHECFKKHIQTFKDNMQEEMDKKIEAFVPDLGWIETDPGQQGPITGSFKPVYNTDEDWYESYYCPIWSPNNAQYRLDIPFEAYKKYVDHDKAAKACYELDRTKHLVYKRIEDLQPSDFYELADSKLDYS